MTAPTPLPHPLILIRHGESTWNQENRFTGWVDVDLTEKGLEQARQAGRLLKQAGHTFDIAYTSVLKRAIRTLWQVQDEMDLMYTPTVHAWRLNERHYGALTGLNKAQTAQQYGEDKVLQWRRSYDISPPALAAEDPLNPQHDARYAHVPANLLPLTECLQDTVARVLPVWTESIAPALKRGKRVIIAAHGNSLRALIKYIAKLSEHDIVGLELPNGVPILYTLDTELNVLDKKILRETT